MTDRTFSIWPANGSDKVIKVSRDLYSRLSKVVDNSDIRQDIAWETIRRTIELVQEERAREHRHAKGDYTPELRDLSNLVCDIRERTDGPPHSIAYEIMEKADDCMNTSFDKYDAERLTELHGKLVNEVHKTDEMVVQLGGAITRLREVVKS